MSKRKSKQSSLSEFMKEKIRAACPVCALPQEIRAQLGPIATKKGFSRSDQLEWLREAVDTQITSEALASHFSGHHDQESS